MLFLRLFFGYIVQLAPCAFLVFYASPGRLRFPARKVAGLTAALLCVLAAVYAGAGFYLRQLFPPDLTLFSALNLVFCANILLCLLWFLFTVTAPWQKKLFAFSFVFTQAALALTVSDTIVQHIPMPAWDGLPYQSWAMPVMMICSFGMALLSFLLLRYFYLPVEASISPAEAVYLALLSVLSLTLLCVLVVGYTTSEFDILFKTSLFLYVSLIVTVLAVYVVLFKIIAVSHEKLTARQEASRVRNLLALQEEQYRRISDNIENSRRMRHDLRHHMVALQGFLQHEETERAKEYVENYLNTEKQNQVVWLCGNHTINAVVGHYQSLAFGQRIAFTAQISIPDTLAVQNEDIAVLLGNLLENAIEATGNGVGKRQIRLDMALSGSMLVITVENAFDGRVKMEAGNYVSTKGQHRGIGLQSIAAIAQKYSGFAEFSHTGDMFRSSVMLNLAAENANVREKTAIFP